MSLRGLHARDIADRIVGTAAPKDETEDQAPEGDDADEQDPRVDAARQALDALHDDDAEGFADALDAAVSLHSAAPPKDAKPALKIMLRKGGT